jgi:hypothetical protein
MAFTALLSAIGGYGQGRQQRTQNQQAQQQLSQGQEQIALTRSYQQQQQQQQRDELARQKAADAVTKGTANATLLKGGIDPVTGKVLPPLPFPANLQPGAKGPDGKPLSDSDRYRGLADYAYQHQRPDIGDQYSAMATGAASDLSHLSTAALNYSKVPYEQALTKNMAGRLPALYAQIRARERAADYVADKNSAARVRAASMAAQAMAARVTQDNNSRQYIALMAQLNAANRQDAQTAATNAIKEWQIEAGAVAKNWQAQENAYTLGLPGAANPGSSPTLPAPPAAPGGGTTINYITVQGPNGTPQQVPVVQHGAPPTDYAKNPKATVIRGLVSQDRASGKTDQQILTEMQQHKDSFPGGMPEMLWWLKQGQPAAAPRQPVPLVPVRRSAIPWIAPQLLPGG